MVNLAFLVPKGIKAEERQPIWFGLLPLVAYTGFLMTAAAWALASSLAPEIGGRADGRLCRISGYRGCVGVCRGLRAQDRRFRHCRAARGSAA